MLNKLSLLTSRPEPKLFHEGESEVLHRDLELAADVVDLEGLALVEDGVEGRHDIEHVDVATLGRAVAVQAARVPLQKTKDELGDDLLRILVWPVHVVSPRDDDGELVGAHVGLSDELSSCLGARVRVRGLKHRILKHTIPKHITVHLVSGHVDELLDGSLAGARALEERVRAEHVGLRVDEGVAKRGVDVGLSGEVHHVVDLVEVHQVSNEIHVADVAAAEEVVGLVLEVGDILGRGALVDDVQVNYGVVGVVVDQVPADVASDEATRAGDQDVLLVRAHGE
mmetsp:Transcript_9697/g.24037  ORF Transcript_9697/g.24037 Transcript_9697/m.24037 type:complete len:283 (-) Transcript_9697:59-907(-)